MSDIAAKLARLELMMQCEDDALDLLTDAYQSKRLGYRHYLTAFDATSARMAALSFGIAALREAPQPIETKANHTQGEG